MSFVAFYPPGRAGSAANPSVGPNGSAIPADSTLVGGENPSGNLEPLQVSNTGNLLVEISASSAGLATEATLSSFSAKSGSSDIHVAYDYRSFTYVGSTQKIDTIVYKQGGSGGTTVATQTFGYDGSDRLTSITTT